MIEIKKRYRFLCSNVLPAAIWLHLRRSGQGRILRHSCRAGISGYCERNEGDHRQGRLRVQRWSRAQRRALRDELRLQRQ